MDGAQKARDRRPGEKHQSGRSGRPALSRLRSLQIHRFRQRGRERRRLLRRERAQRRNHGLQFLRGREARTIISKPGAILGFLLPKLTFLGFLATMTTYVKDSTSARRPRKYP